MPRLLVHDRRIVTRDGRFVTARPGEPCACCGPTTCWYYLYLPCASRSGTPDCPVPDPVYVTSCWLCTSGSTPEVVFDPSGFCWVRDGGGQRYLPNPGTGEDPPAGFQWIPAGATVWDQTQGPCTDSCLDPECRTFDRFVPAQKCACSNGPGPQTMYFRCEDVAGIPGCVVGKSFLGLDCYEVDRDSPSVPGPIDPSLIIEAPTTVGSCCECCETLPGTPCSSGLMPLVQAVGCPYVETRSNVPVCCDGDAEVVEVGYIVSTLRQPSPWPCPPDIRESWWRSDSVGTTVWFRNTTHLPDACTPMVSEFQLSRGRSVRCDSPYVYFADGGVTLPEQAEAFSCEATSPECPGSVVRRETPRSAAFTLTTLWTGLCEPAEEVRGSVLRTTTGGTCDLCGFGFTPPGPVVPLPGSGNAGPEGLGFTPLNPRPDRVLTLSYAKNTRRSKGGCNACGKDGGL